MLCDCGSTFTLATSEKHSKSKAHKTYLNILANKPDFVTNFIAKKCEIGTEFNQ